MRMTNKIMQNNSLYNINNNKMLQDKLSTQMSTQKKLTRPSDDPVIAIRALRLRSDVSQISQFYEKNAPDAESWIKVTSDALNTTTDVINSMIEQATKGSNKDLSYEDLDIIVTQLEALKDEFYATGNVDFAGRYVFTGFRTDTTLTYTEDTIQDFNITEQINVAAVDTLNYTNLDNLEGISKENYDPTTGIGQAEAGIQNNDIYRIRLSYDNLKNEADGQKLTVTEVTDPTTVPPTEAALLTDAEIEYRSSTEDPDPYEYILDPANAGKAVLIPETGELLIGAKLYANKFEKIPTDREIRINYNKDSWKDGDLRPQHYFACVDQTADLAAEHVKYNQEEYVNTANNPATIEKYIPMEKVSQVIEYDVGYNQKIRINTTADEVFKVNVDRDVDDMKLALAQLEEINTSRDNLKNMLDGMDENEAGYANLKATYEAADKAFTYIRENVQKKFENLITKVQGTLDDTSIAITDNGTRGSRLDLVANRLMTQKTTFQTLQSSNEDVDVTEVTIQLTSMEYSYQSALMATSKIMQNSLMNYI